MNNSFKLRVVVWYCVIFYLLMAFKLFNGMLFSQLQPIFFYVRSDISSWIFMQTGLHQWVFNHKLGWILADSIFYSLPLLYLLVLLFRKNLALPAAIAMAVLNWIYVECYALYPLIYIQYHTAWLFFPIVFLGIKPKTFSLLFEGLRYFFLFIFFSAGVWKVVMGGVFSPEHMSGTLLIQHAAQLANSPEYWQSRFYLWLIDHSVISQLVYIAACVLQFLFVVGFFTRKYDRWLIAAFLLFLAGDYLVMRIPYFEIAPLMLTLLLKDKRAHSGQQPSAIPEYTATIPAHSSRHSN